MHISNTIAR